MSKLFFWSKTTKKKEDDSSAPSQPKAAETVVPLERSYVSKSRAYRSLLKKSSRNSRFSKDFR